jgi:hypothetical protein
MEIKLGDLGTEHTFYYANIVIRRTKVMSQHVMNDGSYKFQEAPEVKRIFEVEFVKIFDPENENITNLETEYDKGTTLNFIYDEVNYTVKFVGELVKATSVHGTKITLMEV